MFLPPLELIDTIALPEPPRFRDTAFLQLNYVGKGLSVGQIARRIRSSKDAVRRGLIRAGVELREPHQPHGNPSIPKFGVRKGRGGLHRDRAEQATIALAQSLREQGRSLRRVATELEVRGVPTKLKSTRWHAESARRVLYFGLSHNIPTP